VITDNFNGDKTAFDEKLKQSGTSIADYKQFLREELILTGYLKFIALHSKEPAPAAQAKWIASLRKGAGITVL
jgi:hypothetical protein